MLPPGSLDPAGSPMALPTSGHLLRLLCGLWACFCATALNTPVFLPDCAHDILYSCLRVPSEAFLEDLICSNQSFAPRLLGLYFVLVVFCTC